MSERMSERERVREKMRMGESEGGRVRVGERVRERMSVEEGRLSVHRSITDSWV